MYQASNVLPVHYVLIRGIAEEKGIADVQQGIGLIISFDQDHLWIQLSDGGLHYLHYNDFGEIVSLLRIERDNAPHIFKPPLGGGVS